MPICWASSAKSLLMIPGVMSLPSCCDIEWMDDCIIASWNIFFDSCSSGYGNNFSNNDSLHFWLTPLNETKIPIKSLSPCQLLSIEVWTAAYLVYLLEIHWNWIFSFCSSRSVCFDVLMSYPHWTFSSSCWTLLIFSSFCWTLLIFPSFCWTYQNSPSFSPPSGLHLE